MHIKELLNLSLSKPQSSVPDWMIGCFKRKSITFANGQTDKSTHVFWLQGRNQTIDLRLPIDSELVQKQWQDCSNEEMCRLADYEGWCADSKWKNEQLSWSAGVSCQLHNRWPEPAILSRVGNCMMEFSPRSSYVEDWRIQTVTSGPLISLKLIEERNLTTNELRHIGGALIVTSNWAGLVLGRARQSRLIDQANLNKQLREQVNQQVNDADFLNQVFNFETSVAMGHDDLSSDFTVSYSTNPTRINKAIMSMEGFDFDESNNEILQIFKDHENTIQRRFSIDAIETEFLFSNETSWHTDSKKWFDKESQTLGRYTQVIS